MCNLFFGCKILCYMSIRILNYQVVKNVFYTVKNGDTLESIAKKFGVSKRYIIKNNIADIYQGLMIYLPETNFKTYTVQPFDTLSKISQKCNISVDDLMTKNNLENEYVFVGQKLFV